ncbi:MAG: PorT family protein [Chlorobi bacterium]|nr:PorT family protein [Chlorobiota bacterium]
MKKAFVLFSLLCLYSSFPALGQDAPKSSPWEQDTTKEITTHIGLGVSFSPLSLFPSGSNIISLNKYPTPAFYIPMKVGESFKIEPMIWYTNVSKDKDYKVSTTMWAFGAGFLYLFPANKEDNKVEFSVGTRFAVNMVNETRTGSYQDSDDSYTVISMGIVNGAEYYLTRQFSLGGELMLFYQKNDDTSISLVSFGTAFFIRWFFN